MKVVNTCSRLKMDEVERDIFQGVHGLDDGSIEGLAISSGFQVEQGRSSSLGFRKTFDRRLQGWQNSVRDCFAGFAFNFPINTPNKTEKCLNGRSSYLFYHVLSCFDMEFF